MNKALVILKPYMKCSKNEAESLKLSHERHPTTWGNLSILEYPIAINGPMFRHRLLASHSREQQLKLKGWNKNPITHFVVPDKDAIKYQRNITMSVCYVTLNSGYRKTMIEGKDSDEFTKLLYIHLLLSTFTKVHGTQTGTCWQLLEGNGMACIPLL